ncbi:putative bifunctional inhibitor/plant lipid transfer protein/seed storage helical [Rosa chinensis]|uniref:Putative bifunctional inhibitor/plant lipid transfer protein/seed storage helical n=1 Tax=Rosa chinensis TaxID=74649 RepID=A0A2P6PNT6_ROSCH|nr:putative lipid-transfer protein DIR1 [Rosa chinensis]PRQ23584.1 putative bifunctional inhibitor/plant lipid transfer protein/seed storage helical [Rosa chinensis]
MEAYKKLVIIAALVLALAIGSNGQGQSSICRMTKDGFVACAPSVTATPGIIPAAPTAECCSALSVADFPCLCFFMRNSKLLTTYGVDPNLAMQLPAKCKLARSVHC